MKKFLSLVLALVMTMSLVTISAGAKDFTDASKINYAEAVDVLSAVKVIDGDTTGAFNPQGGLTRGAAAKIICNLILGPTTASALHADAAPFKDVPADSTYAGYIAYCVQQGITSGYTNGTYRPTAPLTGYAFMKMLLGALGYEKDVEGYDGANWSINVAKRALNIGLDKGLDGDFNGVKAVTREEACLYAFNALKADMVEYDAKTSISVGGADVVIAGSAAKTVANKATTETISNDDVMQFAEKYFPKLVLTKNIRDDFARPAHKWTNKNDKIGTYCDTPDLTYTSNVKLGTIYSDLDLDAQIDADVYRNGVAANSAANALAAQVPVNRGNGNKLGTGTGTLVEVYYNADKATIDIIVVDTYVGEISAVKAETAARDAYVVVSEARAASPLTTATDEFETDDAFEVEDVVLYTYSESKGAVKSVVKAEKIEGTLNTIYLDSKVTIEGTKYSLAENVATDTANTNLLNVKSSYVAYLDPNGNIIDMDESEYVSGDYAFVEDGKLFAGGTWSDYEAKLVYLDGTTAKVKTDKNYAADAALDFVSENYLVTYKTNSDNEVVLKQVTGQDYYGNSQNFKMVSGDAEILINDDDQNGAYTTASTTEKHVFANSKTMIVVKTTDGLGRVKYNAYTGVKNMPTITGTAANPVSITWYCKGTNSQILTYAFIQTNATAVTGSSDKVYFLAAKSMSKHTTDTDLTDYYTFNAVVNGEITTVRVDASASYVNSELVSGKVVNKTFNNLSFDRDGIITTATASASHKTATKVTRLSGEHTFGFDEVQAGCRMYYTIADDCKAWVVDADGEITSVSVNSIVEETGAINFVINTSNEVTHLFVQEGSTWGGGSLIGGSTVYTVTASISGGTTLQVAVAGGAAGDSTTAVTVDKIIVTNLTNGITAEVSGSVASGTKLTGGALTATNVTGLSVTANGVTTYQVVLNIGGEKVASNVVFA